MFNHAHVTENDDPDVLQLLEDELKSCVLPEIKDTSKATTDDIVKDMHRVLTGNGGLARGMIYKVAAANVNTKILRHGMAKIKTDLTDQIERCASIQKDNERQDIVDAADKVDARKVRVVVWNNRYLIIAIIAGIVMVVFNTVQNRDIASVEPTVSTKEMKRLEKMVETIKSMEKLDPEVIKTGTSKAVSNKISTATSFNPITPTTTASNNRNT